MRIFNPLTWLIVLGVVITTTLPILAAINLAREQAVQRQEAYLREIAGSALFRAESTGAQLAKVSQLVGSMSMAEACSEKGLDTMRRLDLGSTLLQAVGYAEGDVMRCSSLGGRREFELGPVDLTSVNHVDFRTHVKLFDPKVSYLAVSGDKSIAVIHKDLVLSFVEEVPGLRVGVFNWSQRKMLMERGSVSPAWFAPKVGGASVFRDADQLVAVVRSKRYDLGAVAALPASHFSGYVWQTAKILIPIGVLVGLILSAVLIHVILNRASMPMMIRSALKHRKFHLLYQPVIDLQTGRTIGVEALIRWPRGKGDFIPPDVFIPVAEEVGLIPLVTARVLELLADDARHILRIAPGFHFAVNFSAQDMHRTNILDEVSRLIRRSGIAFENLVIEATERSLVDVDLARTNLQQLRGAGVKVAIDDFGTGYSSLAYLAQLEVDYLKIDKLFVQSLGTDSATSQVALRIIEMAKDLDLKIVAEGIETRKQERLLKRFNVELAQGYLYGRPMGLDELLPLLRAERHAARATDEKLAPKKAA